MQLILSIDDIGIKNNMSAVDEIIQNEKEVKNPLVDNILSYSKANIIDDSIGKQDKIVQDSHNLDTYIVHSSNGTITNDDASVEVSDGSNEDSKISVCKTANVQNGSDIQQAINKEVDLNKNAPKNIKTEYEKDAVSVVECIEKQISPNGTSQINCDKSNDTDMKAAVKSETKDGDESHLENILVIQTKDGNESLIQATDVIKNEKQTVNLNDSLEEKQAMDIYQDELEDFDADVSENAVPQNAVIDSLENTDDNQQSDKDNIKDVIENAIPENEVIDSLEATYDNQQSDRDNIKDLIENDIPENAVIDSLETTNDNQQSDRDNTKDVIENAIQENAVIDSLEATYDNQQSDRDNIKDLIENDIPENAVIDSLETTDDNQQSDRDNTKDVIENANPENAVIDSLETKDDNQQSHRDNNQENGPPTGSISDEIIDIADDKDSCDSTDDKGEFENKFVENIPLDIDSSDESIETQIILKNNNENFEKSSQILYSLLDKPVETSTLDKIIHCSPVLLENIPNKENTTEIKENSSTYVANVEPANKIMKFRLSNNLDILSDDEDGNTNKPESPKSELEPEPSTKQCINIEDDDDIMLIDDETTTKENKTIANDVEELNIEPKEITNVIDQVENKQDVKEDTIQTVQCKDTGLEEATLINEEQKEIDITEKKEIQEKSPLLSPTFLKSFKKNLSDMTREELEDFCILKIVESVIDKSSLGEIKSQLKVVAEKIDDYKGRANVLAKQNRDLQLVLKSVQEELKKDPGAAINPLKITRSVGMQITLNDKSSRKRQCTLNSQTHQNANINNQNTTNTNNKNQVKSQIMQSARTTKPQQQQIPVPRLIPAVNTGTKSCPNPSPQAVNNISKSPTVNNIPNGMKNPPSAAKPEKRTHSKMQQMYVDLTDDEPPAKNLNTRVFNSSVRCVPPQALLAPQRAPLSQNISSPKKVYIPISGPQSQNIRPGQHIVLKSVSSQVSRPRGPSPNTKTHPSIRNARFGQRHPAPLPDVMKQYQPPNWKPLPPPPELKLAKVENGLVISWKITGFIEENHEEIASYQLYAYQETSIPPSTSLWKKIGDVKALPLPMACTLTQFISGYKYYFAVRAVDIRSRYGNFSLPGSILLGNNP